MGKLIAAQFVRPFVKTNRDAADAQAIWETVTADMRLWREARTTASGVVVASIAGSVGEVAPASQ